MPTDTDPKVIAEIAAGESLSLVERQRLRFKKEQVQLTSVLRRSVRELKKSKEDLEELQQQKRLLEERQEEMAREIERLKQPAIMEPVAYFPSQTPSVSSHEETKKFFFTKILKKALLELKSLRRSLREKQAQLEEISQRESLAQGKRAALYQRVEELQTVLELLQEAKGVVAEENRQLQLAQTAMQEEKTALERRCSELQAEDSRLRSTLLQAETHAKQKYDGLHMAQGLLKKDNEALQRRLADLIGQMQKEEKQHQALFQEVEQLKGEKAKWGGLCLEEQREFIRERQARQLLSQQHERLSQECQWLQQARGWLEEEIVANREAQHEETCLLLRLVEKAQSTLRSKEKEWKEWKQQIEMAWKEQQAQWQSHRGAQEQELAQLKLAQRTLMEEKRSATLEREEAVQKETQWQQQLHDKEQELTTSQVALAQREEIFSAQEQKRQQLAQQLSLIEETLVAQKKEEEELRCWAREQLEAKEAELVQWREKHALLEEQWKSGQSTIAQLEKSRVEYESLLTNLKAFVGQLPLAPAREKGGGTAAPNLFAAPLDVRKSLFGDA